MKTVIVFKLCKDPRDATISADGTADWGMAALKASDDDFRSTEIAKELGGSVTGLTIGNGDISWAAARGAAETTHITDVMPSYDLYETTVALASAIRKMEDVDLVLIGDSLWEPTVPVLIGAELGWTSLAGVVNVKSIDNGYKVTRRTSNMEQEIEITGPAVLAIAAQSSEETPPGLKQVLMARKKKVNKLTASDIEFTAESRVSCTAMELPESTEAEMITGKTPEEIVDRLFAVLKQEGVL